MATVEDVARQFKDGGLVTIALENESETFIFQKIFLCSVSKYFASALESGFKETEEHTLTLPGSDLQSLKLFVYWLCKRDLPDTVNEWRNHAPGTETDKNAITDTQDTLVRLWCFADRFLIPQLQNAAMRPLLTLVRISYVRTAVASLAFRSTPHNSPLRTVIARRLLYDLHPANALNNYGEQIYEEADMDQLGSTPGFMAKCLTSISETKCKTLPCSCESDCYRLHEREDDKFMVAE